MAQDLLATLPAPANDMLYLFGGGQIEFCVEGPTAKLPKRAGFGS
jgi:hypothetical protein